MRSPSRSPMMGESVVLLLVFARRPPRRDRRQRCSQRLRVSARDLGRLRRRTGWRGAGDVSSSCSLSHSMQPAPTTSPALRVSVLRTDESRFSSALTRFPKTKKSHCSTNSPRPPVRRQRARKLAAGPEESAAERFPAERLAAAGNELLVHLDVRLHALCLHCHD